MLFYRRILWHVFSSLCDQLLFQLYRTLYNESHHIYNETNHINNQSHYIYNEGIHNQSHHIRTIYTDRMPDTRQLLPHRPVLLQLWILWYYICILCRRQLLLWKLRRKQPPAHMRAAHTDHRRTPAHRHSARTPYRLPDQRLPQQHGLLFQPRLLRPHTGLL